MQGFLFYRPAVSEGSGGQREGRLKIRIACLKRAARSVFRRPNVLENRLSCVLQFFAFKHFARFQIL